MFHFVLELLLCYGQVPHIRRVRSPELSRRVEEDIPDALDDRRLLALAYVHDLEETAVAFAQIEDVAEGLVDELVDLGGSDNWWRGGAKRADEQLRKCIVRRVLGENITEA